MFWVLFSLLIVAILFKAARPRSIHDEWSPKGRRRRYVIINQLTGYYCFDGRLFRTEKAALKQLKKMSSGPSGFGDIFTIRQADWIPAR